MIFKYIKERLSPKGLLKYELAKGVFAGIFILIAVLWIASFDIGNPYHEYQLITNGITTNGFIIDAIEVVEDGESGRTMVDHYYTYTFETEDGRTITSEGEGRGGLRDEFFDLIDPIPMQIVYLKNHPEINNLKGNLCDSIWELLWRRILLYIFALVIGSYIGFPLIRNAVKEYSSELKSLPAYIDYLNKKKADTNNRTKNTEE
ncbi:hypothetical protein ACFLZD_01800 [Candidatus Neomarinimicrobiota bacterium]